MRALWSDRPNCSHNVSQKVKRIRRFSDYFRRGNSLKKKVKRLFPQAKLRPKIRITRIIGNNRAD